MLNVFRFRASGLPAPLRSPTAVLPAPSQSAASSQRDPAMIGLDLQLLQGDHFSFRALAAALGTVFTRN